MALTNDKRSDERAHKQLVRYVLVGGFNTIFGYVLFALLNWTFRGFGSFSYMYAAVLGNLIAITVAFLGYKWFVFRTRGNYLAEWIRCVGVYGSTMLIGLAGLAVLVPVLRHVVRRPEFAPYIAGAIVTSLMVLVGFVGHRSISFRQGDVANDAMD